MAGSCASNRGQPNAAQAWRATMATTPKSSKAPSAALADERRSHNRFDVEWAVDCVADDTFLYAAISNISAMGIFVKTTDPLTMGTRLVLSFEPPGHESFKLEGSVAWINPI